MDAGSTTIGGCGDINRNVMMPPVPIVEGCPPAYRRAGAVGAVCAELFVPQTEAFSEIWCDGERVWRSVLIHLVVPLLPALAVALRPSAPAHGSCI